MGSHDQYGKQVLILATNGIVEQRGPSVEVSFGAGLPGRIDGAVGGYIAIEVESRTSKQVRGAVLDLICHPYPKKLLVLLPVHMTNPDITAEQSENIFARFLPRDCFRVLLLHGSGNNPKPDQDAALVSDALSELGYNPSAGTNEHLEPSHNPETFQSTEPKHTGGKYRALEQFLGTLAPSTRELSLTFRQLEKILSSPLPESASTHREWWANQTDTTKRPQAKAWTKAGFRVDAVSQSGENSWVRFVRQPSTSGEAKI